MRKKRGYKREMPEELLRDYKLFAIACEGGKREPEYFKALSLISRKITVDVIEDIVSDSEMEATYKHKSAPKWVLDRAIRYIEKEGLDKEDELWFVMDVDRWSLNQIRFIAELCSDQPNWNIAISNPCFEVWLYFHKEANIGKSLSVSCNDFKKEISSFEKSGYNNIEFIESISKAIIAAKRADSSPEYFLPKPKETKVYKLAERIVNNIGKNEFAFFFSEIEKRKRVVRSKEKGKK